MGAKGQGETADTTSQSHPEMSHAVCAQDRYSRKLQYRQNMSGDFNNMNNVNLQYSILRGLNLLLHHLTSPTYRSIN